MNEELDEMNLEVVMAGLDPAAPVVPAPVKPAPVVPAPVVPAAKPTMMRSVLNFLEAKRGPLPTWSWGLIGAGVITAGTIAIVKLRKRY